MKKIRFGMSSLLILVFSVISFSTLCSAQLEKKDQLRQIIQEKSGNVQKTDEMPARGVENLFTEYWVQFLALVVSLTGVFFAVTGFTFAARKKKKSVANFINQIDDTFASFKWKSKRCEAELYRLEDLIEDQLKNGKLDESSYNLLMKRIKKYLKEVQEVDDPVPKKHPAHPERKITELAEEIEDGEE